MTTNLKVWVGDNPRLMQAIIDRLEHSGCTKHPTWNPKDRSAPNCGGLYVNDQGQWYFESPASTRDGAFRDSNRPESPLSNFFPILYLQDLAKTDYKIWIGSNPKLSEQVQRAVFALGYGWAGMQNPDDRAKVLYTDNTWLILKGAKLWLTRGGSTDPRVLASFLANPAKELFPHQIPGQGVDFNAQRTAIIGKYIRTGSTAVSHQVQKALFALGFKWPGVGVTLRTNDAETSLLVQSNGDIQWSALPHMYIHPYEVPGFHEVAVLPILTREQLIGKYIRVSSKDRVLNERVQQALFALRLPWYISREHVVHHDAQEYIKIDMDETLSWTSGDPSNNAVLPEQIPGFISSQQNNTSNANIEAKIIEDSGTTRGSCLRAPVAAGKVASTERLVGNRISVNPGRGSVRQRLLSSAVLYAADY